MNVMRCVPVRDEHYQTPLEAVEIFKGSSYPETNDRPSFLTTLPAELRNEVYKWLFARDDPIIYTSSGPSHDLGPSVAILRTCRQVFHEAVGVLYSGNEFIISANFNNHNGYTEQFHDARDFLYGIGTQVAHVKEIQIGISPLCSASYCDHFGHNEIEEHIDLLPLARLKWYPPSSKCGFRLIDTGRVLDRRVHYHFPGNQAQMSRLDVKLLEDIVKAVGNNSVLKTHGRFDRLINKIELSLDLKRGSISYPITGPYHAYDKQVIVPFEVISDDEGRFRRLHWRLWTYTSDLHPLPRRLYRQVMRWAMYRQEEIFFDLDRRTAYGLPITLLQFHRSMRHFVRHHLSSCSPITISMTTKHQRDDFGHWKSLKAWLGESISDLFPKAIKRSSTPHAEPPATIVLRADLATPTTLIELRIGVTSFVELTYELRPHSLLRFELHHTNKDETQEFQDHTILLSLLRKRLFVFISKIMEEDPWLKDQDCPEIWINGYGQIVEATFPKYISQGRQPIMNKDFELAIDGIELLGQAYFKSLENQDGCRVGPLRDNALNQSASLGALWKSLASLDWPKDAVPDWSFEGPEWDIR